MSMRHEIAPLLGYAAQAVQEKEWQYGPRPETSH